MSTIGTSMRLFRAFKDWIGNGKIVSGEVANARADVCLGKGGRSPCPKHVSKPAQEIVTASVATIVRERLELKNHLKLKLDRESELHTCGMCECWLPLKVFLPLDRARDLTPDWSGFPDGCWIKNK